MKQEIELPDDVESLQEMLRSLTRDYRQLQSKHDKLQEQINLLLHKRFGANSEKYQAEQSDLFNEAETYAETLDEVEPAGAESEANTEVDSASVVAVESTTPSRKPGRNVLPAELPRIEIVHELLEDQRRSCAEGNWRRDQYHSG